MEAQVVTIDQPFHSAYEKLLVVTDSVDGLKVEPAKFEAEQATKSTE